MGSIFLDNIDFEYQEECGGNDGRYAFPNQVILPLLWRGPPLPLETRTDEHFTDEVIEEARRRGLGEQLYRAYLHVVGIDTTIRRRNGITTATYGTVYIQGGAVRTRARTVRLGLCGSCMQCGPVGLDCLNCSRDKFEQVIFNRQTHDRGEPVHAGKILGNQEYFNPPRDETMYTQYDITRDIVLINPLNVRRMLGLCTSELLEFDRDCQIINARNAFGWTQAVAEEIFPAPPQQADNAANGPGAAA